MAKFTHLMKAHFKKYVLDFKRPSGTSRGILTKKDTWFLIINDDGKYGIGECGLLKGLSYDNVDGYETKLKWVCDNITLGELKLLEHTQQFPSIQFGIEQAFLSLKKQDPFLLFPSEFTDNNRPIPINGLIWMGEKDFMLQQVKAQLEAGFSCIKMKIGAIDFEAELSILKAIRKEYSEEKMELRVDANGAFEPKNALEKLKTLSDYDIHSIEQPIKPKNWELMAELCQNTPIPIALDEELIGIIDVTEKEHLLQTIMPQYIILKPSLVGGYQGSEDWIQIAESIGIEWWITSALESNIGLNAISQWTYRLKNNLPQGLGTGSLYTNNLESPLVVEKGNLYYRNNLYWQADLIGQLCT